MDGEHAPVTYYTINRFTKCKICVSKKKKNRSSLKIQHNEDETKLEDRYTANI